MTFGDTDTIPITPGWLSYNELPIQLDGCKDKDL